MEKGLSEINRSYEKDTANSSLPLHWILPLLIIAVFAFLIFGLNPAPATTNSTLPAGIDSSLQRTTAPPVQNSTLSPANNTFGLAGTSNGSLLTNFEYIDGLNSDLNLYNSWEVLNYIFANLPDKVVVYPTENYFYFRFTANGYTVKGSFSLFAQDRDEGHFGMGYIVYDENPKVEYDSGRIGAGAEYTDANGVFVKKITDMEYDITVENKTVKFILNDVGVTPPQKAQLLPEESYIGTTYDESGLRFFLIYNAAMNKVYWLLDEDVFVPEQLKSYLPQYNLVRGDRTDLVFYNDKNTSRKILIGAKGENVLANNWYDGPFDQMPDNYVKRGLIDYNAVIKAYYSEGRVDEYLGYIGQEGTRIAVAPYTVYFDDSYFDFVGQCIADANGFQSRLYACITVQQYNVPESYYSSLGTNE